MSRSSFAARRRRPAAVASAAAAVAVALLPASVAAVPAAGAAVHAAPAAAPSKARISTAFVLPGDRVYPEGIAADPRHGDLYAGSFQDGAVYRMRPGHRVAEVFLPAGADGRSTANGLKVDRAGRLWVTSSASGVAVYDTRTRRLLARFDVPGPGTDARFVNDLAITPDGTAYLTDSFRSVVYRVTPGDLARARGGRGTLSVAFDLDDVLDPHKPGDFTLNGIVADPTGRFLLAADAHGGDLYRLDLATGGSGRTVLQGADMLHADGLELQHGRLWTVHNVDDRIVRWRVAPDGRTARREASLTDASLQLPTTLARLRGTLYVVRSQFDKGGPLGDGTPELPFTIAAVRGL
ncbi:SMP-30/gluconolactonase/LRE family protein [Actinomadura chibensis]|uniref:SMP-30/gluconolactonase/LRE family protein n=1 Tax=Actinomadura chibensis TaxID=392828 RepID=A0A5D0NED2_9ACTN|nr:SMP-30/gluconolactonase/LRE family protein [Actinomadura chibensis]TYB42790.1 SMP-30/gluconolactonase/LRE family protein [Actinomadura chibensis]